MNHINHINLSEGSQFAPLITTYGDGDHSTCVISFESEGCAEAALSEIGGRPGHSVARLYKKKESPNELKLS